MSYASPRSSASCHVVAHSAPRSNGDPRIRQFGPQLLQPGSDPTLDGALGVAELFGHFTVGEPTEVGEFDRRTFALVQRLHGITDVPGERHVPDLAGDVVARIGGLRRLAFLPTAPRRLGPDQVDRTSVGVGEQEAAQRAAFGVEAIRLVPQADEHLLHDLLGAGMIGQQPAGQPEDRTGVATVGLGERVLLEATDRNGERTVGHLTQHAVSHLLYEPDRPSG